MYRSLTLVAYPREVLHPLIIVRFYSHLVVDIEVGDMSPGHYHFDEIFVNQAVF